MKAFRIAAATAALGASLAVVPGVASANKHHPNHQAKPAHAVALTKYVFRGVVAQAPASSAVQVLVQAGSPTAVQLLGSTNPQLITFNLAAGTQYYSWNSAGTAAAPIASTSLLAGDPVAVTLYSAAGPVHNTLANLIAGTPATRVDDYLNSNKPAGRIFLFEGRAVSVDQAAQTVTMTVTKGNWRALYALKGQPMTETFKYGPSTVFLHWGPNGHPHMIPAANITAGDRVTIRVFSSNYDSRLSTLLSTPAWRINDHEPQSVIDRAISGSNAHTL
jgi:hypothetical protein